MLFKALRKIGYVIAFLLAAAVFFPLGIIYCEEVLEKKPVVLEPSVVPLP